MKKINGFTPPDPGFFERQEMQILDRSSHLETWRQQGAGPAESSFPVNEAFWLQMEEDIRSRIRKPEKLPWIWAPVSWKPVFAAILLFFAVMAGIRLFQPALPTPEEVAMEKLSALEGKDMMNYLSENPEALELGEQIVLQQMNSNEIELPVEMPVTAEQLLDESDLSELDLESSL